MTVGRIPSVEGGIQPTLLTAKGDLISATAASTVARLAVGSNDQILVADSTASTGLAWSSATTLYPWTTYTPTLNNWTKGNGTVVGRYQQIGKTTIVFFQFTFGSTSSVGGAGANFTLPVNTAQTLGTTTVCNFQDAGTQDYPGTLYLATGNAYPGPIVTNATYSSRVDITPTIPFTWTTNDTITIQVIYEAV